VISITRVTCGCTSERAGALTTSRPQWLKAMHTCYLESQQRHAARNAPPPTRS
jgi:hypothetical protein